MKIINDIIKEKEKNPSLDERIVATLSLLIGVPIGAFAGASLGYLGREATLYAMDYENCHIEKTKDWIGSQMEVTEELYCQTEDHGMKEPAHFPAGCIYGAGNLAIGGGCISGGLFLPASVLFAYSSLRRKILK